MTLDYERHVFHSPEFRSVVAAAIQFFSQTPVHKLPPTDRFDGAGVYGIYYVGAYELYSNIANENRESCLQPIYVGKAVPSGWRPVFVNLKLGHLITENKAILAIPSEL